ncbi:MAG: hypothetical protein ACYTGX_03000 [Planctomycetota bacterium]|jgi:hypothetical protein
MRPHWIVGIVIAAAGCGDGGDGDTLKRLQAEHGALTRTVDAQRAELKETKATARATDAALEGAQAALKSETERANRLAQKLGTTEMELSDAELLITELQNELKRTRAALQNAQAEGERKAFERLKRELETRRAAAQEELEARAAERKRNTAAWTVALQKIAPGVQSLLTDTNDYVIYVAGFGYASDRPLYNIRVKEAFTGYKSSVVEIELRPLRDALVKLTAEGLAFAHAQGHAPTFDPAPVLRFYDTTAADPDDSIGRIVAEWKGDALTWRK